MENNGIETKNIVGVVFDFDIETKKPKIGATEYTYFFKGQIQEGDVAVVLSPQTNRLTGVLVVNCTPGVSAIRRASKAIFGIIDAKVFYTQLSNDREIAEKEAWERYNGQI